MDRWDQRLTDEQTEGRIDVRKKAFREGSGREDRMGRMDRCNGLGGWDGMDGRTNGWKEERDGGKGRRRERESK